MRDLPQPQLPTPPAAPPTPAPGGPAPTPAPGLEASVLDQIPRNAAEVRALQVARAELSDQLISVAGRREELARELQGATGANRAGIEARIQQLDQRILQIEADIGRTGQLLAAARRTIVTSPPPIGGGLMDEAVIVPVVSVISLFVLFPIALAYARNIWRRGSAQQIETKIERENADRLARLEGAVDSIAVELERVSEGQRFVTKLLAESESRARAERIEAPRD